MKAPRWLRSPWTIAALGGAAWTTIVLWIASGGKDAPPPGPVTRTATRIGTDPIALVPGTTYAGAIVTHGAANAAGHDAVVSAASKRGFVVEVASDKPIAGYPWSVGDADWYVVAKYTGPASTQARSQGSFVAGAEVVDAMRVT